MQIVFDVSDATLSQGDGRFHPFGMGSITLIGKERTFVSREAHIYILPGATELLDELPIFLANPRTKQHIFDPIPGGFPIRFEKRKNEMVAVSVSSQLIEVLPASDLYRCVLDSVNAFADKYLVNIQFRDGTWDDANAEIMQDFEEKWARFQSFGEARADRVE